MARWLSCWGTSLLIIIRAMAGDSVDSSGVNDTRGDPPPAHAMHRLIPSVLDMSPDSSGNYSSQTSPANITDTVPFLPVGVASVPQSDRSPHNNFTPSYFIGEVIAEPYVPERFQTNFDRSKRNSTSRSYQSPVSSQTALAFNKILPYFEKMKGASFHQYEGDYDPSSHVPPVHETPDDEEDNTTPKYMVNYADNDEHSDRPNRHPYKFQPSLFSTKPIAFEDTKEDSRFETKNPHENPGYSDNYHQHDHRSTPESYHGHVSSQGAHQEPISGYQDPYLGGAALDSHPLKGHHLSDISNIPSEPHYDDFLHHHGSHDFVLPSPFYPSGPGPAHAPTPEHHHHKGILYNVFQK